MTTEIAKQTKRVLSKEETINLMKPVKELYGLEQAEKNRTLLAFELDVVSQKVQRFGWQDMAPEMKDRLTKDWVDCLEAFPIAEVKRAIGDCLEEDPKKCPTEQAVRLAVHKHRAKAIQSALKPPETDGNPDRATKEQAAGVLKQAGVKIVDGKVVL